VGRGGKTDRESHKCVGSAGCRELHQKGEAVYISAAATGGWLGRAWAEAGRGTGKVTSVSDLLAVASYIRKVRMLYVELVTPHAAAAGNCCMQGHWQIHECVRSAGCSELH
jgi:hypothetical protein